MAITVIQNKSQFDEQLDKNELVMIKFTASWCGPCKQIQPLVEKAEEKHTQVAFVEVDVDKYRDIAANYEISSMPTFVFLHQKNEIARVRGSDANALNTKLNELVAKNPNAQRAGDDKPTVQDAALSAYLPKGFDFLNDLVFKPDGELLNSEQPEKLKEILSLEEEGEGVISDADSQLLTYIPMNNRVKVHSILIKAKKGEESQLPNKIKVWANTTGPISFEDASDGVKALHQSDLTFDDKGIATVELRYVLFQSVSSLLVFLDGEDEDESTKVDKIVLIGNRGEAKDPGKLSKIGDELGE